MNNAFPLDLPTGPMIDNRSRKEFQILARVANEEAGLVIPIEKAPMVFARVTKRLRALGIADRSEYCRLIENPGGANERRHLVNALTTNVTSFFREAHHFDTFEYEIMPDLCRRAREGERVRIWSAGCSSGPEPYSIAMIVLECIPDAADLDVKILATDIDSQILQQAQDGRYTSPQLEPVRPERRRRFFNRLPANDRGECEYQATTPLRNLVSFRELNLLSPWPMRVQFDVIFCRNVVIYFDRNTQNELWSRFQSACASGGYLFLGHSERIDEKSSGEFRSRGTTTYRRLPAKDT